MAFLRREVLFKMGFVSIGDEVFISDKAGFYNTKYTHIGHHVRISDYCVLSADEGGILIGKGVIRLGDFCNLIISRIFVFEQ